MRNEKRKVSDTLYSMKREAGANPARSRHRISRAKVHKPLGNWEGGPERLIDQSGDLPFAVAELFALCHEELAIRRIDYLII